LAIVAFIPARFGSTRLPGKPLSDIHGKPMIRHVYERVQGARRIDRVIVATDDARIAAAVVAFGGEAVLTSPDHASGTDRVAEAAAAVTDAVVVVNVQGDEPTIDPGAVDAAVEALVEDPALPISTLSVALRDADEMLSPDVVKVICDARGNALYFSRGPIPHLRLEGDPEPRRAALIAVTRGLARKHVGLYAFRRDALARFAGLPPSALEKAEGLEQLRALENGIPIRVVPLNGDSGVAVDTPQDLERVRERLAPVSARPR
jgi:3-deoxy-manno-octulosonate cytidylyltransferase (CMP-KDO synthetase)